jgi:CHAT domain-containing protein
MQVLTALGESLLTPILSALSSDIERIIFLPSGQLFLFPLHAVPLFANNPALLCDRYEVSYAPSLEVLSHTRTKVTQETVPALYAVINPEDKANLPFAPTEGAAIAQFFTQRAVDTGQVGTKERVLAGMRERTYIHFACHGSYDWDDPPASGLRLAGEILTLADLQQSNIDLSAARLVTLSACETGMTDVVRGSAAEYVGIPAGFLLAGVPCVISSLWAVPDLSTAMLMERFYQNHIQGGMTFAAALSEAQRWVRDLEAEVVAVYAAQCYRQASKKDKNKKGLYKQMDHYRFLADQNPTWRPFAHPYYWAAFTVNGI